MLDWTGTVAELIIAFIGGGLFTSFLTETFSRRRERNALLLQRTTSLVKAYQLYVRLLRHDEKPWSEEALDRTHAEFMAEIRVLTFYQELEGPADELSKIARRMVNIRTGADTKEKRRAALGTIYKDFDTQLKAIIATFHRRKKRFNL